MSMKSFRIRSDHKSVPSSVPSATELTNFPTRRQLLPMTRAACAVLNLSVVILHMVPLGCNHQRTRHVPQPLLWVLFVVRRFALDCAEVGPGNYNLSMIGEISHLPPAAADLINNRDYFIRLVANIFIFGNYRAR
jgi:hypothetical protein